MLRHAWYAVISPEGCAAILWKQANPQTNGEAARALKITASDNLQLGIVDDVIDEALGGAQRDPEATAVNLKEWVTSNLAKLRRRKPDTLLSKRYDRFRALGAYEEIAEEPEPVETPES